MHNQQHMNSHQMATLTQRQSFRIKIIPTFNRSKTSHSDYVSQQISTSCQTFTQSTSRISSLWQKKDWFRTQKLRQNKLNSLFRVRRQKLQQITRENKNLYIRLNTKSSQYSYRQRYMRQSQQKQNRCYAFRTIDMRESREILGPIGNFNGLRLRWKQENNKDNYKQMLFEQFNRQLQQKVSKQQNSCLNELKKKNSMTLLKLKQLNTQKYLQKDKIQLMRLSIRKKLALFNNNNQNNQNQQQNNNKASIIVPKKLIKQQSIRYHHQVNNQNQQQIIAKTSQRVSLGRQRQRVNALPEIYSFF